VTQGRAYPSTAHTARLLVDDASGSTWWNATTRPVGHLVLKLDTDRDISGRYPRGW
jgi:hypothetical protein